MKPYKEYRKTDIPWVESIPYDWQVKPFYTIASESKNSNVGMKNDNLLSLSYGNIVRKNIDTATGLLPESFETYQIVKKDSLIFRLTDLQNDKRSLRSAITNEEGIITSAYVATIPNNIRPRYLHYLMRSYDTTKVFYNLGSGMRQALKYNELKHLPVILPPEATQDVIVTFLDKNLDRIDNLIVEKQNFIKLLEEKRQALISHVVTKGLDDSVEMKDSGVEWIGELPVHWRITKLKFITKKIGSGKTPKGGAESYKESGVLFLRSQNIYNDGLRLDDAVFIDDKTHAEMRNSAVKQGDILLNITGGSIGRTCFVDSDIGEANVNQHVCIIRTKDILYKEFLSLFMKSKVAETQVNILQSGAGREGLNFEEIGRFLVALPPKSETLLIVNKLNVDISRINELANECLNSINLLKEHRSALISAAVTGKIDVREAI